MNWCAADHSFPAKQVRGALELKGTKPARLARACTRSDSVALGLVHGCPSWRRRPGRRQFDQYTTVNPPSGPANAATRLHAGTRSEEHTSELQSLRHLV